MVTQVVDYFHLNNIYNILTIIYNKSEIVSIGTTLSDSLVSILMSLYILLRFFALSYTPLGNLLSRILDLTIMILLTIICKTLVDIFLFRDITDLLLFHISHPISTKFGGMQFKVYQEINYRNLVPDNPNKPQYFALYKNAKKIASDQIILLKGGADYIESLKQTEAITELCENLMEKAYVNYNPEGITLDQCIATCMHYDTVVKKNLSHPPTYADILNSAQMAAKVAATKNKIKLVKNEAISE